MTMPGKPINGGGVQRIPVWQSPDYVAGVSGFALFINGDVEFNNGVFRGVVTASTFEGTDFVINSDGAFWYSGVPATGNLFMSLASSAGIDGFGNAYPQGFAILGGLQALMNLASGGLTTTTPYQAPLTGNLASVIGLDTVGLSNKLVMVVSAAASASPSTPAGMAFDPQTGMVILSAGARIVPQDPGAGKWTAEAWHVIGQPGQPAFGAGFGAPGAGDQAARFRLDNNGTVLLDGVAVTTAATAAGAALFTLPSASYFPLLRKRFSGDTNASGYTAPGQSLITVSAAGVVSCAPACSGAGQSIILDGIRFPVD